MLNVRGVWMMPVTAYKLEEKINHLKKELVQIVQTTGLNSYDTLCCSQKLDELIIIHQKQKAHNKQSLNQRSYSKV